MSHPIKECLRTLMGIWGHYLEGWSNHSAGPTPSSKEIHQNQFVSLDNTIKVILQRHLQESVSLRTSILCFAHIFGQIFQFQNSASYFISSGKFKFYNAH